MSAGYISEIERGLSAISLNKLVQIADGLKVDVDALLKETAEQASRGVVQIPEALSRAAERLNLSHRTTLTLLQGRRSLTARRAQGAAAEWAVDDWVRFYEQVKDYLSES